MTNPSVREISSFLDTELKHADYTKDASLNGLQIESSASSVQKIGFAVDAGLSVAQSAIEQRCQLLVVHHGVLWGENAPITGPWARKLALFLTRGLSLYASHLPLDGHLVHGNAAQIALLLSLSDVSQCFEYGGAPIGVRGSLSSPQSIEQIAATLSSTEGALQPPLLLPFGQREIRSIGIATGAGTGVIPDCAALSIDLLITGEPKQAAYHMAKEYECSVLCIGHYASETFGIRALERVLAQRFNVQTVWISEPTGI